MEVNKKNKAIFDTEFEDYMHTYCKESLEMMKRKYKWSANDTNDLEKTFNPTKEQLVENAFKFAIRELSYKAMKNKDYHILYGNIISDNAKLFDVVIPYDISTNTLGDISVLTLGPNKIPDKDNVTTDNVFITNIALSDGSMDNDEIIMREVIL